MARTLRFEDYTIAWIAVLQIEAQAAVRVLDVQHEGKFPVSSNDDYIFIGGNINDHNVVIATLPDGQNHGVGAAAALAGHIKARFPNLWFSLLVGVAAGVPNLQVSDPSQRRDIRLGDVLVCVPEKDNTGVIQYDLGVCVSSDEGVGFTPNGRQAETIAVVRSAVSHIRLTKRKPFEHGQPFATLLEELQADHDEDLFDCPPHQEDVLYCTREKGAPASTRTPLERKPRPSDHRTRVWYGKIGSGNTLVRSARRRDMLRDQYDIIGLEMEAAGVMNVLRAGVIRGVCDYADGQKDKRWQPYAAAVAAVYAKGILSSIDPRDEETLTSIPTLVLRSKRSKSAIRDRSQSASKRSRSRSAGRRLWIDRSEAWRSSTRTKGTDYFFHRDDRSGKSTAMSVFADPLENTDHDSTVLARPFKLDNVTVIYHPLNGLPDSGQRSGGQTLAQWCEIESPALMSACSGICKSLKHLALNIDTVETAAGLLSRLANSLLLIIHDIGDIAKRRTIERQDDPSVKKLNAPDRLYTNSQICNQVLQQMGRAIESMVAEDCHQIWLQHTVDALSDVGRYQTLWYLRHCLEVMLGLMQSALDGLQSSYYQTSVVAPRQDRQGQPPGKSTPQQSDITTMENLMPSFVASMSAPLHERRAGSSIDTTSEPAETQLAEMRRILTPQISGTPTSSYEKQWLRSTDYDSPEPVGNPWANGSRASGPAAYDRTRSEPVYTPQHSSTTTSHDWMQYFADAGQLNDQASTSASRGLDDSYSPPNGRDQSLAPNPLRTVNNGSLAYDPIRMAWRLSSRGPPLSSEWVSTPLPISQSAPSGIPTQGSQPYQPRVYQAYRPPVNMDYSLLNITPTPLTVAPKFSALITESQSPPQNNVRAQHNSIVTARWSSTQILQPLQNLRHVLESTLKSSIAKDWHADCLAKTLLASVISLCTLVETFRSVMLTLEGQKWRWTWDESALQLVLTEMNARTTKLMGWDVDVRDLATDSSSPEWLGRPREEAVLDMMKGVQLPIITELEHLLAETKNLIHTAMNIFDVTQEERQGGMDELVQAVATLGFREEQAREALRFTRSADGYHMDKAVKFLAGMSKRDLNLIGEGKAMLREKRDHSQVGQGVMMYASLAEATGGLRPPD
ncbi:hypothetical protein KVT40_005151 [Elsinoe batatas]|uniref:Nucleoside phosphorylase domain-containing protein n=1 Tax=Elsinoe batatas TaxID=2601811 RepID=A0A8K0L8H6_9PEZI|nr:hypothetical protein KVT40_005151 [Elsinoe batatas]